MQAFISDTVRHFGYLAVFLLMVPESACIPIPSEFTMTAAGWFAYQGDLNLWVAGLVGAFANLIGSLIAYAVGATGGRALILRYGRFVRLNVHHLDKAEAWFERYGDRAVFWSRLLPVVRTFISLPAGAARMKLNRFSLYSFAGSLPWCIGLAFGGYELGKNWEKLAKNIEVVSFVIVALIAVAAVLLFVRARHRRGTGNARELTGRKSSTPQD
jgi:membrane protein DedA with SNARE-associated domain